MKKVRERFSMGNLVFIVSVPMRSYPTTHLVAKYTSSLLQ